MDVWWNLIGREVGRVLGVGAADVVVVVVEVVVVVVVIVVVEGISYTIVVVCTFCLP